MCKDTQKMSEEVQAEYTSSLADLKFNSKPLINMLAMLAEEKITYAREIVEAIEKRLAKVDTDAKLPILYLIDCIVKKVGSTYMTLFSQNIVCTFCNVFKVVDENIRAKMFKLRQSWNEVFPQKKLYAIDVQIYMLDPAWPMTAQPPTNSIPFNLKFLKNTTGSSNQLTDIKLPIIPVSPATNVALKTISMQQQLIVKQKELLELQQKKLELELLRNQMKLQEQIHGKGKNLPGQPQNILVKREVANEFLSHMQPPVPGSMKIRPPVTVANSVIHQRLQQAAAAATGIPKINPVNSALIAASSNKLIRDHRILRQQHQIQQQEQQLSTTKNHEDDPKRRSPLSSTHVENKSAILDSSNKIVNNKLNVRESARVKHHLINNKESLPSQNNLNLPRPKSSSHTFQSQKPFRSSSSCIKGAGSESSDSKSSSLKGSGSSSSSLDLPVKNKLEKLESKLSSKVSGPKCNKKKDSPIKGEKTIAKEATRGRESPKIHTNEVLSPTFKGAKSSKNRNYIKRNRSPPSPDSTNDVDLRVTGSSEKYARLQTYLPEDKSKTIDLTSPTKDVDLRQIPAIVGKKRHSVEAMENTAKKSKTEIFDQLFGNEDTDMRQLPIVSDKPKTPPPPIISSSAQKEIEKEKESPKQNSNLEAVHTKLAMATNKGKIMKSCNLDVLSSHLMSMAAPVSTASTGYHIENNAPNPDNTQPGGGPPELPAHKPSVDINELLQKLVATGMVTTNQHQSSSGPMPSATTSAASTGTLVSRQLLYSRHMDTTMMQSANTKDKMIPGLEVVNLYDDDDEKMPEESKKEVPAEEVKSPVNGNSEAEPETKTDEPPEEMEDDDDVIIHEVVPEMIIVDDDDDDYIEDECSYLSQPELSHRIPQPDDGFMDVEDVLPLLKSGGLIKVKMEPIDKEELPDPTYDENEINSDEPVPVIEADEPLDTPQPVKRITGPALTSSIDGNVELDSGLASTANLSGRIKINISKPISVITTKETARDGVGDDNLKNILLDPSQPLPPAEEPVQLNLKPALQGIELKKLPPVQKGTELTGMCSIM